MADKSQISAKHNRTKAADDADNCRLNVPTVNGNPVTTRRKNENDMQISSQNCRSTDQSNTGQASNSNQTANSNGSTSKVHPLFPKLRLMACLLSGKNCNDSIYQPELKKLF